MRLGYAGAPDEVWAGSRQAGLFCSTDRGTTWQGVAAVNHHATTATWMEGAVG